LVADTFPADLRGTACGFFYLVSGLAMLLSSGVAGWLWDSNGAAARFLGGAAFLAVALMVGWIVRRALSVRDRRGLTDYIRQVMRSTLD
jgi:MFS family permease